MLSQTLGRRGASRLDIPVRHPGIHREKTLRSISTSHLRRTVSAGYQCSYTLCTVYYVCGIKVKGTPERSPREAVYRPYRDSAIAKILFAKHRDFLFEKESIYHLDPC
ncbi:hypothetical protein BJX66DRAFT_277331 [Aspergillus keveii]|uniref:Uncharacterized protein n=1 Tax=Aspergillus keveii TaxID=714993 RepID=A0ABR4GJP6_9EURO